jgi:hypothetical protein
MFAGEGACAPTKKLRTGATRAVAFFIGQKSLIQSVFQVDVPRQAYLSGLKPIAAAALPLGLKACSTP